MHQTAGCNAGTAEAYSHRAWWKPWTLWRPWPRQSRFHTSGGPRRRPCLGEGRGRRIYVYYLWTGIILYTTPSTPNIYKYIYNICSIFTSPAVTLRLVRNASETELQDEVATSMLQTNLEVAKPQQIATWQIMARHVGPGFWGIFFGLPTKTHTHTKWWLLLALDLPPGWEKMCIYIIMYMGCIINDNQKYIYIYIL